MSLEVEAEAEAVWSVFDQLFVSVGRQAGRQSVL